MERIIEKKVPALCNAGNDHPDYERLHKRRRERSQPRSRYAGSKKRPSMKSFINM
jgi:hypothetical protein